jgi:glycosyltransferase involved in cell wall biosynthesis
VTADLRVLSLYEGFFAGGARVLHTDVVAGLHAAASHRHSVLSIHRQVRRETVLQRMEDDRCYRVLSAAGVPITSLGRSFDDDGGPEAPFSAAELDDTASRLERADVVVSLKEQPLRLLNRVRVRRPVIVCLHRSDPQNQGTALDELRTAVAEGRVVAGICCAESTKAAYQAAGIPGELLHVIPNGVDLTRFRMSRRRTQLRRALGVPRKANVVVFAARYAPMKNVPLFVASARAFLERDPNGHVVMCGAGMGPANGELATDLQDAFGDAPKLLRRLHLQGIRHDMENVYAAADVVSLTSAVGEAAPLCLIEGTMCGAVPVTTDVGDSARIVAGHGLVTAPDPGAISTAWSEAIQRRPEFALAHELGRERFSLTRMVAAYGSLIDRHALAPSPN